MSPRRSCCCGDCLCPWCSSGPCWEDYPTVEFSATVAGVGMDLVQTNLGVGGLISTVLLFQVSDIDDCGIEDVTTNICVAGGEIVRVAGVSDGYTAGFYFYMRGSDLMMLVVIDYSAASGSGGVSATYTEEVTLVSGGSTIDCDTFSESGSATLCFDADDGITPPGSVSWSIARV